MERASIKNKPHQRENNVFPQKYNYFKWMAWKHMTAGRINLSEPDTPPWVLDKALQDADKIVTIF